MYQRGRIQAIKAFSVPMARSQKLSLQKQYQSLNFLRIQLLFFQSCKVFTAELHLINIKSNNLFLDLYLLFLAFLFFANLGRNGRFLSFNFYHFSAGILLVNGGFLFMKVTNLCFLSRSPTKGHQSHFTIIFPCKLHMNFRQLAYQTANVFFNKFVEHFSKDLFLKFSINDVIFIVFTACFFEGSLGSFFKAKSFKDIMLISPQMLCHLAQIHNICLNAVAFALDFCLHFRHSITLFWVIYSRGIIQHFSLIIQSAQPNILGLIKFEVLFVSTQASKSYFSDQLNINLIIRPKQEIKDNLTGQNQVCFKLERHCGFLVSLSMAYLTKFFSFGFSSTIYFNQLIHIEFSISFLYLLVKNSLQFDSESLKLSKLFFLKFLDFQLLLFLKLFSPFDLFLSLHLFQLIFNIFRFFIISRPDKVRQVFSALENV